MPDEILHCPTTTPTHAKLCLFYVYEEPAAHAGIIHPNSDVISLKDGRIFHSEDEGKTWRLIHGLKWADMDDFICDRL